LGNATDGGGVGNKPDFQAIARFKRDMYFLGLHLAFAAGELVVPSTGAS
jgi:hypothetical protein